MTTEQKLREALESVKWDLENCDWHCENCGRDYGMRNTDAYLEVIDALSQPPTGDVGTPGKLYAERDAMRQGEHYIKHLQAMTVEDLHYKSDIAAELAHRDIQIEQLQRTLHAKERELAELQAEMNRRSGSPVTRLHNICESLEKERDGSEFSKEEWDRIDAENLELKRQLAALQSASAAPQEGKADVGSKQDLLKLADSWLAEWQRCKENHYYDPSAGLEPLIQFARDCLAPPSKAEGE